MAFWRPNREEYDDREEGPIFSATHWSRNNQRNADTNEPDPQVASNVIKCLGKHWDLQMFSDFTVRVDNREFKCHKFVLSACSEFFAGLLRSDMLENSVNLADVGGMSPETFALVLDSLYRGKNILTTSNMLEVWHASNQLQIEFLIKSSEDFVIKNLSADNCVDIHKYAKLLDSTKVLQAARTKMASDFETVMQTAAFRELSVEDLLAVMRSPNLNARPDSTAEAVMRWMGDDRCSFNDSSPRGQWYKSFGGQMHSSLGEQKYSRQGAFNKKKKEKRRDQKSAIRKAPCETQFQQFPTSSGHVESSRCDQSKLEHLATLLEAAKLENVSNDCLSYLMSNETVLECQEAIRLVNKMAAQRLNSNHGFMFR